VRGFIHRSRPCAHLYFFFYFRPQAHRCPHVPVQLPANEVIPCGPPPGTSPMWLALGLEAESSTRVGRRLDAEQRGRTRPYFDLREVGSRGAAALGALVGVGAGYGRSSVAGHGTRTPMLCGARFMQTATLGRAT